MLGWNEPLSGLVFIPFALKSSVVLCAAGLLALLLRRQSAAARHVVWTAAFIILLALPFFSVWMPALKVPISDRLLPSEITFQIASATARNAPALQAQSLLQSAHVSPTPRLIPDWPKIALFLWGLGVFVSLGRMMAALAALRKTRRSARRLTNPDLTCLAERFDIGCPVELIESGRGSMPMTFGFFRQAIFLPSDVLEWGEERRRLVILHELAHVRRHDAAAHVLARAALAIWWWNPLAWMAWREFLKERERAADDLVLNTGTRPSDYANHLLAIATNMQAPAAFEPAAVAMARRSQLEGRLVAILESGRNRRGVAPLHGLSIAILAILIAAPLAALQSQDHPSSSSSADSATAQLSGEQSGTDGIRLLKAASLEYERGKLNEADRLYMKAIPLLGNSPEVPTALLRLGAIALINKNPREAIDDFTRAQALNTGDAGRSDMWMAIAQDQEGLAAEADASYQGALRKSDPNSALAATIMDLYAQFLSRQGRASEAQPLREQSAAARKALGGQTMSIQNAAPNVYKIGGDVTVPVLLSKVEPEYSQDARAAKYQGTVLLYVEIGADGSPRNIKVLRGLGLGLDEKATQAVSRWKFKPSSKDGQPVNVAANVEVNFRLL